MPVEVTIRDERTITVPIPAGADSTQQLAAFVASASEDGYLLVNAYTIERGQRDPIAVGLRLTYKRP